MAKVFWKLAGLATVLAEAIAEALDNDYVFMLAAVAGFFAAVQLAVHAITGGWVGW